ncbi:MAG TPA: hypothetical protein VKW06_03285 [Candidatus Angelobacter sp.]|nr:hypothetical protein [Candidatus Angelobacter sp.]
MTIKLITAAFIFNCALLAQTAAPERKDPFQPLQFLIGTWEAKSEGGSAGATTSGAYSFAQELRNHVIARHTTPESCKGPNDFDCGHDDIFYIYTEFAGGPLKAVYFDNEGHVIYYDVSTPNAGTAVFLSDSSRPGPQFRLSYELKGSTMYGEFGIRAPGQTEFKTYLRWSGGRKLAGKSA